MSQFYNIGEHGEKVVEYHGLWSGLVKGKVFTVHKSKPGDRYPEGYDDGDYWDSRGHHRRRHRHHDSSRRRDNTHGYDDMSNESHAQSCPPWSDSRESPFEQYRRQEATSYRQSNYPYDDYQDDGYPERGYQDDEYWSNASHGNASHGLASNRGNAYRGSADRGNAYQDEEQFEPKSAAPSCNPRTCDSSTVHDRPPTGSRVPTSNTPRDNYHTYGNPTRRMGAHVDTRHNPLHTNGPPRYEAPERPTTYNPIQSKSAKRYRMPTPVNN